MIKKALNTSFPHRRESSIASNLLGSRLRGSDEYVSSHSFSKRLPVVLAIMAILAGCSMVPPYERPTAPVPEQFPGAAAGTASKLPGWQEYYADPALHTLIEAALKHNRDLKIALARVEEARAQAGIARADRFPTLEAQASGNRTRTPADLTGTGVARTSSRFDVGLGITAFELDFWGRVAALDEAAKAQYLASEQAAQSFRISLISDAANTWFQLVELTTREELTTATLQSREDSLALTRKRFDAGLASELDVLTQQGLTESLRAQRADLQRQRQQSENALRLLTGMGITLPQPGALPATLTQLTPGLPSEVLLRRPDVRAAEQKLIAANANVGAARAAFFPRIALTANLGTASHELAGLFDSGSQAWLFQPVLKFPLFDAGRTQANIEVAEARKVQAVADYEKTIQQAFREVADALAGTGTLNEQLSAQEKNLEAQRTRVARVKAREWVGVSSYLEVLDASRDAYSAEQSLASTRRQLLSAQAVLYKALGGGE